MTQNSLGGRNPLEVAGLEGGGAAGVGAARGADLVKELELDVLLHAWEAVAVLALGDAQSGTRHDLRHADGERRVGGLVGAVSAAATSGGCGGGGRGFLDL